MWELFDIAFTALEFGAWWRFFLCLIGSIVLCGLAAEFVENDRVVKVISVPIVAAGAIGGAVWEYRSREKTRW